MCVCEIKKRVGEIERREIEGERMRERLLKRSTRSNPPFLKTNYSANLLHIKVVY